MTATDELRRMLDERGMEHYDGTESTLWGYEDYNEFTGIYRFSADETSDGRMQVRLWHATPAQAIEATLGPAVPPPPAPDQPPYDVLLDILASEWGIDASWDGLRRFWCVELNDEGVRKRDELHAENAKLQDENARLRSCLSDDAENARMIMGENAKLRELVRYMYQCFVRGHDWGPFCAGETVWVEDRMRELGIEVSE